MSSSTQPTELFLIFTAPLEALGLRYLVTGSVASILYGEPRMTHDIDIGAVTEQKQDFLPRDPVTSVACRVLARKCPACAWK